MSDANFEVKLLELENGKVPFETWYYELKDQKARVSILSRLTRARFGNFGDCKYFHGIGELKIDIGPGYRVYFALHENELIILLAGGVKNEQQKDIDAAVKLWKENKNETERFRRDFRP